MSSALVVLDCGPGTSLQDRGRFNQQRFGLSSSGAMDLLALATANALVGNPVWAAALEFTLLGGRFRVEGGPVRLALSGARSDLLVDGRRIKPGVSATAQPGEVVTIAAAREGVYATLAVAGGLAVEPDMGSLSLQLRAGIGGLGGQPLHAGDRLPLRAGEPGGPELSLPLVPLEAGAPIRVVLGPQDDHFDEAGIAAFLGTPYRVSQEADRMGYRLSGPRLQHARGYNIVSDGIVRGSVQVPGAGVPIVMMADHQTTGGYPKIATVISADLRLLAQRRPGDAVRFAAIGIEEAQATARERAGAIAGLAETARPALRGEPSSEELLALNLAGAAVNAFAPAEL